MGRSRGVLLLERDQDFAVHRADGCRIAQAGVGRAVWQTDIIEQDFDLIITHDFPDRPLDEGKIVLGVLHPGRRWSTYMQTHLPGVYLRKKVHAQTWKDQA